MTDEESSLRVGVDLGGTKTEAVVLRLQGSASERSYQLLARVRTATDRDRGYEHVVDNTARLIDEAIAEAGLATRPKIGVGMPGSITMLAEDGSRSDVARVKNSNTTCLNGRPFRRDLSARLGATIAFANDANCFALAEATFGEARGEVVFGVILGTGVGGGVVLCRDGTPWAWDGAQGIAGEWGHVSLDPAHGPPCYCGRRGCIEQYLSGPAIEARYAIRSNEALRLPAIAERANKGETHAIEVLDETADLFGRALSIVIDVLDPAVIVVGGGVSNLEVLYRRGVREVARWIFNDELRTKIVKHSLGDSAGVLGAALLP